MRTETVEIFTFDELSDDAKEKARDWWRQGGLDHEWWDYVVDDFKHLVSLIGVDVDDVYFSGFASQGDGAMFLGSYAFKAGGLKALVAECPTETELHTIARDIQAAQRKVFYKGTASIKRHWGAGNYSHSGCMGVDVDHPDLWSDSLDDFESDILDGMRGLADWLYSRLEKEYDYLMSDEQIDETIKANEYEFYADGSIA